MSIWQRDYAVDSVHWWFSCFFFFFFGVIFKKIFKILNFYEKKKIDRLQDWLLELWVMLEWRRMRNRKKYSLGWFWSSFSLKHWDCMDSLSLWSSRNNSELEVIKKMGNPKKIEFLAWKMRVFLEFCFILSNFLVGVLICIKKIFLSH